MKTTRHTHSKQALSLFSPDSWARPVNRIPPWSVLGAWACASLLQLQAGTTYVVRTDSEPLPEPYLQAIGATNGLPTPGFVFLDPSSGGSLAGVPLVFGGLLNASGEFDHTARFGVAGDLNLGPGDQILGYGTNFLHLEVGGDARIAPGARISVAAVGRFPGAGGGAGGARSVMPAIADHHLDVIRGEPGAGGQPVSGGDGNTGSRGLSVRLAPNFYYLLVTGAGNAGEPSARSLSLPGAGAAGGQLDLEIVSLAAGGVGGSGGPKGVDFVGAGEPGQNGTRGEGGLLIGIGAGDGQLAASSGAMDEGGLYGGAGGGSGGHGKAGLSGAGGGGGGAGGQGGPSPLGNVGGIGGKGGNGGRGGKGGKGGSGGAGGGGGGGLSLIVRGTLNLQGVISAAGGNGEAGSLGESGLAGEAGTKGSASAENNLIQGGHGGDGGDGGHGAKGGPGGAGGGGAGGTLSIAASQVIHAPQSFEVNGGWFAMPGILRVRSDLDGVELGSFVPTASRFNPYNSRPREDSLMPLIAQVHPLLGGPDGFGIVADAPGEVPNASLATFYRDLVDRPTNAVGLIQRYNGTNSALPLPQVYVLNIGETPLSSLSLAVNHESDPFLATPTPLMVRGYLRESLFATNATGAEILTNFPALNTWVTFCRTGNSTLSGSFTPYSKPVSFSLATTGTDLRENLWLLDTGLMLVGLTGSSLPLQRWQLDRETNQVAIPVVLREGTTPEFTLTLDNIGNPNSRMSGDINGQAFADLAANVGPVTATTVLSNLVAGPNPPVAFRVSTDAGEANIEIRPTVYGPALQQSLSNNGNAGEVALGQSGLITYQAANLSHASLAPPETSPFVYLLNVSLQISGPDAAYFRVEEPMSTQLADRDAGTWVKQIRFTPDAPREYHATLSVATDQNAGLTGPGLSYQFPLTGFATAGAPLQYSVTGPDGELRIEWSGTGLVLQQNTNLLDPAGWVPTPGGTTSPVIVIPGQGSTFFRLQQP